MEANKTICNDCGKVEFWVGWKTRTLQYQRRDQCRGCGSKNIKIEPDTETETGKAYQESEQIAAREIAGLIGKKLGDE
jgi:hypothetical protein